MYSCKLKIWETTPELLPSLETRIAIAMPKQLASKLILILLYYVYDTIPPFCYHYTLHWHSFIEPY